MPKEARMHTVVETMLVAAMVAAMFGRRWFAPAVRHLWSNP